MPVLAPGGAAKKAASPPWTFAVSGDSRNCGDFVMPAIAAKVKAENDVFYWHLGDFRWITMADQDFLSMQTISNRLWLSVNLADYRQQAWDDFRDPPVGGLRLDSGFSEPRQSRHRRAHVARRLHRKILRVSQPP